MRAAIQQIMVQLEKPLIQPCQWETWEKKKKKKDKVVRIKKAKQTLRNTDKSQNVDQLQQDFVLAFFVRSLFWAEHES